MTAVITRRTSHLATRHFNFPPDSRVRSNAMLQFRLNSAIGVDHARIADSTGRVTITVKPGYDWHRVSVLVVDCLARSLQWPYVDITLDGRKLGWDDFPGSCML